MSSIAEKYGIDMSYEHKTACPRCRRHGDDTSGNNLHVYGEGKGAFCWACNFTILSDAERAERGLDEYEEDEEVVTREKITAEENEKIKSYTTTKGKGYRGIRDETNAFFGVRYKYSEETGEPEAQYVPTTVGGELAGYRVRKFPKDFSGPIGQVGKECDMIFEFRFKNHTRTCLIAGGETKALTSYQMLKDDQVRRGKEDFETIAVVCSTLGESGAYKQVQSRYDFFNQFQKIIICMDNDKAGKEAAEKIAKVLPKGKAYIMSMRFKDADDYVEAGKEKEFIQDFWNAKPYMPVGIVGSGDLYEKILEEAATKRVLFPPFMSKLNDMTGGMALGKIVNIGAGSGLGKTVYINEMVYHWIFHSPYKIGVVSMELNAGQYGMVMLSRHLGRKIAAIRGDDERLAFLQTEDVRQKQHELFFTEDGGHRWLLVDDRDGSVEDLKTKVEELVIGFGCKVIVLDPLQDILDGMDIDTQAVFLKWQKGLIKSHNMTFVNINHIRKAGSGEKASSTGAMINEESFAGSSTIFKSAALNILLTRDKLAEDEVERNTTHAYLSKNRDTGVTGPCGEYYFDNSTHTLWNKEEWLLQQPPAEF